VFKSLFSLQALKGSELVFYILTRGLETTRKHTTKEKKCHSPQIPVPELKRKKTKRNNRHSIHTRK